MKCPTCGEFSGNRTRVAAHHGMVHPHEVEDRFWMYVTRGADDECWLWEGVRSSGYGMFWFGDKGYRAHRVSYRIEFGGVEHQVNHTCGNKACVNPAHLYDGTQEQNMADAAESGNGGGTRGSGVGTSKLVEDEVVEIRERYSAGASQYEIASDYPVTQAMVSEIVRGNWWSHAGGPTVGGGE